MEELIKTSVILTIVGILLSHQVYSQDEGLKIREEFIKLNYLPLSIKAVIQQGIQKNYDQQLRRQDKELLQLEWDGNWEKFWLPTVDIKLSILPHQLAQLKSPDGTGVTFPKASTGIFGVNFGEYKIFNWGKDYLAYLNTKQEFVRNNQILTEKERELRFNLIELYSKLITQKKNLEAYQIALRHNSYIYRLAKEKLPTKKISLQRYYQIRTLYLRAYNQYYESKRELESTHEQLAFLLEDDANTRYNTSEKINYRPVSLSFEEVKETALNNNPAVVQAASDRLITERKLEIAHRENLPLPEISIDLGMSYLGWSANARALDHASATTLNNNLEIAASVNATWNIIGFDGLLNRRKVSKARISDNRAKKVIEQKEDYAIYQLANTFQRLKNYEDQYKIAHEQLNSSQKAYDLILDAYGKNKTSFLNFLTGLEQMTEGMVNYNSLIYYHFLEKINLARITGIPDFPGHYFEDMIIKDDLVSSNTLKNPPRPQVKSPSKVSSPPIPKSEEVKNEQ